MSSHDRTVDPLAHALAGKAATGAAGAAAERLVVDGDGWRVVDIVCTAGPRDVAFAERHATTSISLVLSGTFSYRGRRAPSLLAPGSLLLVDAGETFECAHEHGEGDRCLSFQFAPALFERLAHEAGAASPRFAIDRLPPLRGLAGVTARARTALERPEAMEEVTLALAGAVIGLAQPARRAPTTATAHEARVVRVLRVLEHRVDEPHPLADLARVAGLSRYHFVRAFAAVTGVTPHQWLLRARLRRAAHRLATTRTPVTEVALDVGFDDLSHFIRSFRAEFGVPPSRWRATA